MKIIFDNALKNHVQEIYVTVYDKRPEQRRLIDLLEQWGFVLWGTKGEGELVYVRDFSPQFNIENLKSCFLIYQREGMYMWFQYTQNITLNCYLILF